MKKHLAVALSVAISGPALADGAPLMGIYPADAHQVCGKDINLEIKYINSSRIIIGLVNHDTEGLDLFQSAGTVNSQAQYIRFVPVKFDQLSKDFLPQSDSTMDIVWGAVTQDNQQTAYNLSLGSHVYHCGEIEKWPNEEANKLYGDMS